MLNKVKQTLLISLSVLTLISSPAIIRAEECDLPTLVKELKKSFGVRFREVTVNKNAAAHGKLIKKVGLDEDYAYMVDWKLKRDNQRGPWAMKGNTLIHGVRSDQRALWMEEIGQKSFGLGFQKMPWDVEDSLTGVLRIKDKFYMYFEIQFHSGMADLTNIDANNTKDWTEATFMATDEELEAMLKFLQDRTENKILAKKNLGSSGLKIAKGQPIKPTFNITEAQITQESCAAACTSMFSPDWLYHYDSPTALSLAAMSVEKGLRNHSNAKAYVYSNFRNPNLSAITILGVNKLHAMPASFLAGTNWGDLGGMMWGFIPDRAPKNPSPNYTNTRTPLKEWMRNN